MRLAVVGHVEWFDFVLADRLPAPGEIHHARDAWEAPGGGGAMGVRALRSLTGAATFFCGLGEDDRARRTAAALKDLGLDVVADVQPGRAQRRALTYLTADGERTITVLGAPVVPEGDGGVDWSAFDGVYLTAGDAAAARAARSARVLVANPRAGEALVAGGVRVDVLIGSAGDAGEAMDDALVAAVRPRWRVMTEGARGGTWRAADGATGRWAAARPPGEPVDAYGCGDAFAAALMAGLAAGRSIDAACAVAARVGAAVLCERAPSVGDLSSLW